MNAPSALARVVLFAKGTEALAAFYGAALGLVPLEREPGWILLQAGACELGIHQVPPAVAARIEIASPPEPRAETPLKLVFLTPDLEGARAALEAAGGRVLRTAGGALDAADPEGNVFRVEVR